MPIANKAAMANKMYADKEARVCNDLIYDVGMCNGDDTAYYLHQGYRVLAVEANPSLAAQAERRFQSAIREGRLTVLNIGIAERAGNACFWISDDHPEWGSVDRDIASRSGSRHHPIEIQIITFTRILEEHGIPHYLKIDIEGSDGFCVKALPKGPLLPKYISLETDCAGDSEDLRGVTLPGMLELLRERGYKRFKLICQGNFWAAGSLRGPNWLYRLARSAAHGRLRAPRVGRVAMSLTGRHMLKSDGYAFVDGSSGPWGEGTAGPWLSYEEAKKAYVRAREWHASALMPGEPKYSFWYDWHAAF
jgi:FkbM family methyltransferase